MPLVHGMVDRQWKKGIIKKIIHQPSDKATQLSRCGEQRCLKVRVHVFFVIFYETLNYDTNGSDAVFCSFVSSSNPAHALLNDVFKCGEQDSNLRNSMYWDLNPAPLTKLGNPRANSAR